MLRELADAHGVDLRLCDHQVGDRRGLTEDGNRIYTLADAYSQADFITYPSIYEGFGNALLESSSLGRQLRESPANQAVRNPASDAAQTSLSMSFPT